MDLFHIAPPLLTILVLWGVACCIQIAYYLFLFFPILMVARKQRRRTAPTEEQPPVSVIVYAHNKAKELETSLPMMLEQDYPLYEVVVVDNTSQDDTASVVAQYKALYPHLRSTEISSEVAFANATYFALSMGVKTAMYDQVLFVDAAAVPFGLHWISSMQRQFVPSADFVLGYSRLDLRPGRWNRWIRYDHVWRAGFCFALALFVKPFSGFGNNIAYRKSMFFSHNGFMHLAHLPVGNEPLYLSDAASRRTTKVALLHDAHVRESAEFNFRSWLRRRKQVLYAYPHFSPSARFLSGLEVFSRVVFLALSVYLLFHVDPLWIIAGVGARFFLQCCILIPLQCLLDERKLWWSIPYYDMLVQPVMLAFLFLVRCFSSSRRRVGC